jgi:signal transduction histidine kinase
MTVDLESIDSRRYSDIGSALCRDAELLTDKWYREARERQPSAVVVHREEMRNLLPEFVRAMGGNLANLDGPATAPHLSAAAEHGEQRWRNGWQLSELVRDYQLLRLVVLDHLDRTIQPSLNLEEIQAVNLSFDEAIEASVVSYTNYRERQLKRYVAELERSNQDLEQFASVAAHDLHAPLRAVRTYCDLLQKDHAGSLDSDAEDLLNTVSNSAERMERLLRDLRNYARATSQPLLEELVDCEGALNQAMANLDVAIQQAGAAVTHDPLPRLLGNQTHLLQLFQNLIDNAVKYRGDRPPKIHVSVESQDGEWLFRVHDNGIGINPQDADRIFSPFQRLHGEERYSGTGIGLAICQRIVERHGGRIWVESQPGKGSDFCFTIPATTGSVCRKQREE